MTAWTIFCGSVLAGVIVGLAGWPHARAAWRATRPLRCVRPYRPRWPVEQGGAVHATGEEVRKP